MYYNFATPKQFLSLKKCQDLIFFRELRTVFLHTAETHIYSYMLSSLLRLFEITWIKTNSVRGSAVKWETHILDVPIYSTYVPIGHWRSWVNEHM